MATASGSRPWPSASSSLVSDAADAASVLLYRSFRRTFSVTGASVRKRADGGATRNESADKENVFSLDDLLPASVVPLSQSFRCLGTRDISISEHEGYFRRKVKPVLLRSADQSQTTDQHQA